jgi:hypothetical protein
VLRGSTALLLCALALGAAAATAGARAARIVFFKTPSGNIGCIASIDPEYLRCDIRSGLQPRPPEPKDCHLGWGDSLSMSRTGRAGYVCHGDTVFDPHARALAYGSTFTFASFRCTSRTAGLTCRNAAGHGWFLSRKRYRRF